jgi:hypothetical protein
MRKAPSVPAAPPQTYSTIPITVRPIAVRPEGSYHEKVTRLGFFFASNRGPTRALVVGAVTLVLLAGCGAHYLSRGIDLYAGGHFIEAAEVFERTEKRLPDASPSECARYGLYRGATLLALGDTMHATTWLGYSKSIVDEHGDALSDEDRDMLGRALKLVASRRNPTPTLRANDSSTVATRPTNNAGEAVPDAPEVGN